MRIAFTGAGGTGKTTLAMQVAETWGLPYLPGTAREVMKQRGIDGEAAQNSMSPEALLDLQCAIFDAFKERLEGQTSFVSDRTSLDYYVYALRRSGAAMSEELRAAWEKTAVEGLYKLDLVFYCPAGQFPVEADGIRQTDTAHQHLIDSAIYGLLCKHAFDRMAGHIYVMNMSDRERRKHYVNSLISGTTALGGVI